MSLLIHISLKSYCRLFSAIALFITINIPQTVHSQSVNTTKSLNLSQEPFKFSYSEILKKRYWNFFIRPLVSFQKGTYYRDDNYFLALYPAPGFQFGWMMNFGLPKRFSLQTGINAEVNYISFHYSMNINSANKNFVAFNKITTENYIAYVVPIYVGYRLPINNQHNNFFIETKLGFDVKYGDVSKVTAEDYVLSKNSSWLRTTYFNKGWGDPKIGTGYKLSASIVAGIGFNFVLKNQRIVNVQLLGSYNPFINDSGVMTFLPDMPDEKKISFRNYINTFGIEINYLFTKYPLSKRKQLKYYYRVAPIKSSKNKNQ